MARAETSKTSRRKPPSRPRVPLPRQKGGVHEDKTKRPHRRRKHRKDRGEEDEATAAQSP